MNVTKACFLSIYPSIYPPHSPANFCCPLHLWEKRTQWFRYFCKHTTYHIVLRDAWTLKQSVRFLRASGIITARNWHMSMDQAYTHVSARVRGSWSTDPLIINSIWDSPKALFTSEVVATSANILISSVSYEWRVKADGREKPRNAIRHFIQRVLDLLLETIKPWDTLKVEDDPSWIRISLIFNSN